MLKTFLSLVLVALPSRGGHGQVQGQPGGHRNTGAGPSENSGRGPRSVLVGGRQVQASRAAGDVAMGFDAPRLPSLDRLRRAGSCLGSAPSAGPGASGSRLDREAGARLGLPGADADREAVSAPGSVRCRGRCRRAAKAGGPLRPARESLG